MTVLLKDARIAFGWALAWMCITFLFIFHKLHKLALVQEKSAATGVESYLFICFMCGPLCLFGLAA